MRFAHLLIYQKDYFIASATLGSQTREKAQNNLKQLEGLPVGPGLRIRFAVQATRSGSAVREIQISHAMGQLSMSH